MNKDSYYYYYYINVVKPKTQQVGLGNSLLDICSDMGITQMNNHPSKKENILDLYFTNSQGLSLAKKLTRQADE